MRQAGRGAHQRNLGGLCLLIAVAAVVYFYGLARTGLDDSEAYSAFIANQHGLRAVLAANLNLEPGKPGLYAVITHFYCRFFGSSESALRGFSAGCGLISVLLVFILASDCFGAEVGLAAAIIWTFNPLAIDLARWARMYALFVTLAIASLLAMRKLQKNPSTPRAAVFGVLSAAMFLTHLGALLILLAEAGLLLRDWWRGQPIRYGIIGLLIAGLLASPAILPYFDQLRALLSTHRFDWLGAAVPVSRLREAVVAIGAIGVSSLLIFGAALKSKSAAAETWRWCAIIALLPVIVVVAGSLAVHPMFEIRYLAPVTAIWSIMLAGLIDLAGRRARNLATLGLAGAVLLWSALAVAQTHPYNFWRQVGATVRRADAAQPVFFESGPVTSPAEAEGEDPDVLAKEWPRGFLRVPFEYYFNGANPRVVVNPFRPQRTRQTVADAAGADGGAWLVSNLGDSDVLAELPGSPDFKSVCVMRSVAVSLWHVTPVVASRQPAPAGSALAPKAAGVASTR